MNKFLKRISLVGLLLSTSCGYSQNELSGLAFQACINIEDSSKTTLCEVAKDTSLSCNVIVGVLPSGYMLGKDGDKIYEVYANYDTEKNAWSTDGKTFNIIAVDGNLYKFNDSKTEIFASGINNFALYKKDNTTDTWHETTPTSGNDITVLDFTSENSDYIIIGNTICKKTALLTRDDTDYTSWSGGILKPVQFKFNGNTLTLNCSSNKIDESSQNNFVSSTFRVTQFGEVSCPSNSKLTLEPTCEVENVLLLEPGSKVGKAAQTTGDTVERLSVDKGIIDLSKYFKDTNALAQGQKIYMDLTVTQDNSMSDIEQCNTTSKIKLFNTKDELDNLKNIMGKYDVSQNGVVFKNIALNDSTPLFTSISINETLLNNSIIMKLFDYGTNSTQVKQNLINETIEEYKQISEATGNTIKIDAKDLAITTSTSDESEQLVVTIDISTLNKVNEIKNAQITHDGDMAVDCRGETQNGKFDLSQIKSTGTINVINLPENVDEINTGDSKNIVINSGNKKCTINSLITKNNVLVSGDMHIKILNCSNQSLVTADQGTTITFG